MHIELFGLMPCTDPCRCELHGFEVDLDGNVVTPEIQSCNKSSDSTQHHRRAEYVAVLQCKVPETQTTN